MKVKIFINMDKTHINRIIHESLINEVGGSNILSDFGPEIEGLFEKILNKYGGELSPRNVTYFLMKTVETIGLELGHDEGRDPNRYKSIHDER